MCSTLLCGLLEPKFHSTFLLWCAPAVFCVAVDQIFGLKKDHKCGHNRNVPWLLSV